MKSKEEIKAKRKDWKESNKEHLKEYRKFNKEKLDEQKRVWRQNNKTRKSAQDKVWRAINKDSIRNQQLIQRYDITLNQYNEMLIKQDSKCAICKKQDKLVVDHNHKTGKVRKLLCKSCNMGMGLLKEDKNILLSCIEYIEMWTASNDI